jgi:glycosyltransferase involved in cell wall biosynthesis
MNKVLLSAFACDPSKGSEHGNGWNWAIGLAEKGFEVHCLTRINGENEIKKRSVNNLNIKFHFIVLPYNLETLYTKGSLGIYTYYMLWQWLAYKKAKVLINEGDFKVAHHVTWGSIQMGSFLYKLKIPFVFGPAGGGQKAPPLFRKYFLNHWSSEVVRNIISKTLTTFNPGFKSMLRSAYSIIVSNHDTLTLAKENGAKNVLLSLDAALPSNFYPQLFVPKDLKEGNLKLLWIGRFLPRKGLLLLLDVMREIKAESKNITLTVVGDGEMKTAFLKRIDELDLNDCVFWKGSVPYEQVKVFYSSHDVFFFTSLRDSCPSQLIEAMAYGLPVITINLHGQSLIVNDLTGIRCDCTTPAMAIDSLKEAILTLYGNSKLVTSMSIEAYKFAKGQTWENKIESITNNNYPV